MAVRERDVNGKFSTETSYFISSLDNHASTIAKSIREHWGIENGLHWCLDVAFREDHCRVRKDHAPENFGILRHMAINLLKQEKSLKGGIQTKRLKAAWDHNYLLQSLRLNFTCDCPVNKPIKENKTEKCELLGRLPFLLCVLPGKSAKFEKLVVGQTC